MTHLERVKNMIKMSMVVYDIFMDLSDKIDEEKSILSVKEKEELNNWQRTDRQCVKQLGKIQMRNEELV